MSDTPNERTLKLALETFTELANTLKRERDEARGQIEVCRGIIERTVIARNSALCDLAELERERDEWAAMCGRYKQERDMAEKYVKNYQTKMFELIDERDEMKQERDEAREVVREMWQSGDAFLPYIDQATTNRWRKAAGWEEAK